MQLGCMLEAYKERLTAARGAIFTDFIRVPFTSGRRSGKTGSVFFCYSIATTRPEAPRRGLAHAMPIRTSSRAPRRPRRWHLSTRRAHVLPKPKLKAVARDRVRANQSDPLAFNPSAPNGFLTEFALQRASVEPE